MKIDKDWIKEHKKEIITGGVMAVISVTGWVYIRKQINVIGTLSRKLAKVAEDNSTLMTAASEGLFEEAIATVTRKINYKKDRLEFVKKQLLSTPDDTQTKKCIVQTYNRA